MIDIKNKVIGGGKQESLKIDEADQVPLNPKMRMKALMELPVKQKELFVPPVGRLLNMGPYIFKVTFTNPSQFRFTATLVDVNIEKKEEEKKPDIKIASI